MLKNRDYYGFTVFILLKSRNYLHYCHFVLQLQQKIASNLTVATSTSRAVNLRANNLTALPALVIEQGKDMVSVQVLILNGQHTPWADGDWLDICGFMFVEGAFPNMKFASPVNNLNWVWDGAPFDSTSTGPTP